MLEWQIEKERTDKAVMQQIIEEAKVVVEEQKQTIDQQNKLLHHKGVIYEATFEDGEKYTGKST